MAHRARPLDERIAERCSFTSDDECWEWPTTDATGYGKTRLGLLNEGTRRTVNVHRAVYELYVEPVDGDLQLDHLCRNRACCNPDHLEPVTAQENMARGFSKPRMNALKTHCMRGHEFTPENTQLDRHGKRYCRTCKRAWRANKTAEAAANG